MTEVYLALGSNVGDSRAHIAKAVELLGKRFQDLQQAPLYHSKPVGYTDQPDFLNTAVRGQTDLKPADLLAEIKNIEQQVGRTKTFHWGPREIDIDIIFYGDTILETPELTIPHPAFRKRSFVLKPLSNLNPKYVDPVSGSTVNELFTALPAEEISDLKSLT